MSYYRINFNNFSNKTSKILTTGSCSYNGFENIKLHIDDENGIFLIAFEGYDSSNQLIFESGFCPKDVMIEINSTLSQSLSSYKILISHNDNSNISSNEVHNCYALANLTDWYLHNNGLFCNEMPELENRFYPLAINNWCYWRIDEEDDELIIGSAQILPFEFNDLPDSLKYSWRLETESGITQLLIGARQIALFEAPFPMSAWHINDETGLINIGPQPAYFAKPYPDVVWWIDDYTEPTKPNLTIGKSIALFKEPLPLGIWHLVDISGIEKNLTVGSTDIRELGSFCYASFLTKVTFPQKIKKIGEYAFRFTSLAEVTIPDDCEYFDTSFPKGCIVTTFSENT